MRNLHPPATGRGLPLFTNPHTRQRPSLSFFASTPTQPQPPLGRVSNPAAPPPLRAVGHPAAYLLQPPLRCLTARASPASLTTTAPPLFACNPTATQAAPPHIGECRQHPLTLSQRTASSAISFKKAATLVALHIVG